MGYGGGFPVVEWEKGLVNGDGSGLGGRCLGEDGQDVNRRSHPGRPGPDPVSYTPVLGGTCFVGGGSPPKPFPLSPKYGPL